MKCIGVFIFFILFPLFILSQIRIDNLKEAYSFDAGTSTSIPLTIQNESNDSSSYKVELSIHQPKIQIFNSSQIINLTTKKKSIIIIPLKIQSNCPPGNYELLIKIKNQHNTLLKTLSINIIVNPFEKITVEPSKNTDILSAGDTIHTTFTIKNLGNTRSKIILDSKQGKILTNKIMHISPLEEKIVTIIKPTNARESKLTHESIDLNIIDSTSKKEILSTSTLIEIVPINPLQLDSYKRLPARASLAYIHSDENNRENSGWQGEFYAFGRIANKGNDFLEVKAVTKNPIPYNSFSSYEEYYARYNNEKFYLNIGDKGYTSSALTENFRYGRGIELQYNFNKISISGFYNRPRFYKNIRDEFSIKSTIQISKANYITFGYLQKRPLEDTLSLYTDRIKSTVHLPYFIYKTDAIKNTNIESEVSISNSQNNNGYGVRLQGNVFLKRINAAINLIHSSPNFDGYFQNATNINTSLNYRLSSKFNMGIILYQDARNIQRDTLLLLAPLRKNANYSLNYYYSKSGYVNILSGIMYSEDRLQTNLFKYKELFAQLSINQHLGNFNFVLNSQYGRTSNLLSELNGQSNYHQLTISYNANNLSYSVFGNLQNTSRYSQANKKYYYYGARISKEFFKSTSINILYQNNYIPEEYYKDRNRLEGSILFKTKKQDLLEFNGRYMLQRGYLGNKDLIFSVKFTKTINIPIKRIAHYSTLKGKITNEENIGVSGIRLNLANQRSITDIDGNYVFKNIIPGQHVINIDKLSLPMYTVTNEVLPKSINILKDQNNIYNIKVIQSGSLTGKINLHENIEYSSIIIDDEKLKHANFIIELTNEHQTLRSACKINDTYEFKLLKPGVWNIKIYNSDLSNTIKIINDNAKIDIKSHEQEIYNIELEYIKKEIKFQQESLKVSKITQ